MVGLAALYALSLTGLGAPALAQGPVTLTVNDPGDAGQSVSGTACVTSTGTCTLRAAIAAADATSAPVTIDFAFPGSGPFTISPKTPLPGLANSFGITIDGYSQPGSAMNTDDTADNAVIQVQLRGQGETGINGLYVSKGNNVIRGLAIFNFQKQIWLNGTTASSNVIVGDFLCTNAAGTFKFTQVYSGSMGIYLSTGPSGNIVGAPGDATRNVISGCGHYGIGASYAGTDNNTFQNNIIGLNPAGTGALPVLGHGIHVSYGADGNLIGGTGPQEHNVLSGNLQDGVEVAHGPNNRNNMVIGNWIGTDPTGTAAPAYAQNRQWGIRLEGTYSCPAPCAPGPGYATVEDNTVVNSGRGGMEIDKGQQHNVVAHNTFGLTTNGTLAPNANYSIRLEHGATDNTIGPGNIMTGTAEGVQIEPVGEQPPDSSLTATDGNTITQNSIYGNSSLGIDETPFNVANVAGHGSPYVNNDIQAPVITSATTTAISGTTCANCVVQAFLSDRAITGGSLKAFGEGETYLASATARSNGTFTVSVSGLAAGTPVTVDATDSKGDTSEFSKNVLATA